MNVESITWISARSSTMYACFYLLSLIFYLKYIRGRLQIQFLFISFLFFILSLLCKVQAITLPLVLLLFDYYFARKKTKLLFFEKLPFLLLSVIFTIIAFRDPKTLAYFTHVSLKEFSVFDQVFLNGRTLFFYLQKFLLPVNLSAIYAFPVKSNSWLPFSYYLYSFAVIILFAFVVKFRKNRDLILGAGLFLGTLIINLPLNSVRNVIYTDRYAYFPYLGLLVILASFYQAFIRKELKTQLRRYVYGITFLILVYGLFFSYETMKRNKIWSSDLSLTNDIIQKNLPVPSISKIYRIRGVYYAKHQMIQESIADYDKAIELNADDIDSYIYRAYALIKLNKLKEALPDLDKGIKNKPNSSILYADRAMVRLNIGDGVGAWSDCNQCLSLDSTNPEAYNFRAILKFQSDDLQGAMDELRKAIRFNNQYAEAYKNLGTVYHQLDDPGQACYYWGIAARLGDRQAAQFMKMNCLLK
jgi:hypothetical protein